MRSFHRCHRRYLNWTVFHLVALCCLSRPAAAGEFQNARGAKFDSSEVHQPAGPGEIPESLPGRWKVSLCIKNTHTWIRYQNLDTGEIHSVSRYHVLVGGWYDIHHLRWHYPPTVRPGLYMDREQMIEDKVQDGKYLLLSTIVDDPVVFGHDKSYGHGTYVNNCVTYTRDAWHFYTGEWYDMPPVHTPGDLLHGVVLRHPEVSRRKDRSLTKLDLGNR